MSNQKRSDREHFFTKLPGRSKFDPQVAVMTAAKKAVVGNAPEGVQYIVTGTEAGVAGVKAAITGVGPQRCLVLTLQNFLIDAIAATADEAVGALLYTLPDGEIIVRGTHLNLELNGTEALNKDDTPELGVGTVIGTGAVAVLSGTPAFEDIITAQVMNDCEGTREVITISNDTAKVIATAGDRALYLNIADGWAGADTGMKATGTIIIEFTHMA
jgi:hypothetical protein